MIEAQPTPVEMVVTIARSVPAYMSAGLIPLVFGRKT